MFGRAKQQHDTGKLPLFVHAIQSADAFSLAQRVWEANARYVRVDLANKKDFLRFVFTQPACIVWLLRDSGRSDTYELVLIWEGKEKITEVYVVSALAGMPLGDDTRAKSLLNAILASPATVPAQDVTENM